MEDISGFGGWGSLIKFDKNTLSVFQPEYSTLLSGTWYPEFNNVLIESERWTLFPIFSLVLPAPYLDLDPSFMNSKWLMGVNTTRRGNHNNKYRLSWGSLHSSSYTTTSELIEGAHTTLASKLTPGVISAMTSAELIGLPSVDWLGVLGQQVTNNPAIATRLVIDNHTTSSVDRLLLVKNAMLGLVRSSVNQPVHNNTHWFYLPESGSTFTNLAKSSTAYNNYLNLRVLLSTQAKSKLTSLDFNPCDGLSVIASDEPVLGKASLDRRHGFSHVRENIGSLRRLRLTKGLCLPAMMPIHGIFGSKDVIHSWAIPGLGLKIDCIPGYNSHRRLFLTWRGAFWGQCMEVCGRYHH